MRCLALALFTDPPSTEDLEFIRRGCPTSTARRGRSVSSDRPA